ncbi:four-carbon acid sugar kinase family protein [Proteiniclasticum sp. BAD-10]|uniref:Four-carbon acid sugar kinase family protein n=1 Tax=Proteiniclasticum sediminis TaxID=2804028 RepID=A0A941CN61_9CLOT|nr:four-carbon acid sugar kinase family protein [Proteiniclasticum sediminis]MBR0575147.1 four-carbon acid sugar kinase family protein [Proteiniclasticum sediminis]
MVKLLIIADDFTGALDTGVQFAAKGAQTLVVTDLNYDFHTEEHPVDVLVMVAETRHLSPRKAYEMVYNTAKRAVEAGVRYLYKKTDSALRGNIGSELTALMDAAEVDTLPFIPAFPKINRITQEGIHYIDGIPVAQSVFGQDPFEPILYSAVAELLAQQTPVPIVLHSRREKGKKLPPGIQVFDAETDADLEDISKELGPQGLRFSAGCAGFATVLAELLDLTGPAPQMPKFVEPLFIACGSVNPVTILQMNTAEKAGFPRVNLNPVQKLERTWVDSEAADEAIRQWMVQVKESQRFILDVNDPEGTEDTADYVRAHELTSEELRVKISNNLAALMKKLLDSGLKATLLCTGGDTLMALMQAMEVTALKPLEEMATGVVATTFDYRGNTYHMISKSGGIGEENLLIELAKQLSSKAYWR